MKIVNKELKGKQTKVFVAVGGKNYIRSQVDSKVEWKNSKTNSLVNLSRHTELELQLFKIEPQVTLFLKQAEATIKHQEVNKVLLSTIKNKEALRIDSNIFDLISKGAILGAVKYYKELTGLGLKEAKDYVDALVSVYRMFTLENTSSLVPSAMLNVASKSFAKNSDKKQFIVEYKKINKLYGGLVCMNEMSRTKNWQLSAARVFYDNHIK